MTRIAVLMSACLLASCAQEQDTGVGASGSPKWPIVIPYDDDEGGCAPRPEIVGDGQDQNCDGQDNCYQDLDGDGYGTDILVGSGGTACNALGKSLWSTDCQDDAQCAGAEYYPGNPKGQACGSGEDFDCDADTCQQDTNCGCGACEPL